MTDQQEETTVTLKHKDEEIAILLMQVLKTELDKILKKAEKIHWLGRNNKKIFLAGVDFVIGKLLEKEQR